MGADVERIAEVLEEHPDWHADAGDLEVVMCRLCEWTKRVSLVYPKGAESAFRAHQAEQLTAAGWVSPADVARIKADAWDEGRAHGIRYPYGERGFGTDDNPYRAAAVTEGAGE